jgi:hypothetical protein
MKSTIETVGITVIFGMTIIGMWLVDVGEITMNNFGFTTNGFWVNNASQIYHAGMYLNIAAAFVLCFVAFHYKEKFNRLKIVAAMYKKQKKITQN